MSIYFVHFFTAFLPLCAFGAVLLGAISQTRESANSQDSRESANSHESRISPNRNLFNIIISTLIGAIFAYIASFIANLNLANESLSLASNALFLIALILAIFAHFFHARMLFKYALWGILVFCAGVHYFKISLDFKIFTTELIESTAIISLALVLCAIFLCALAFYLARIFLREEPKLTRIAAFALAALSANLAIAEICLALIRKNALAMSDFLMDYVGKSIYYAFLNPYAALILLLLLGVYNLAKMPKAAQKSRDFDISFRQNKATRIARIAHFRANLALAILGACILLYYDLYASKPITIDAPQILAQPEGGVFEFETTLLSDNKLHRFAYITDEGKEVRFFLLNKFEDRASPVAVFDACALCGDMGYIKRGNELICIACNVRIFLPSVGKFGGCNPIPLEFSVENGKVKIALESVIGGSNYFSKVVSREVFDPVNGAKLLNTEALFSYQFNGITYFFSSQETYDLFLKSPESYASSQNALYRVQKYNAEFEHE